MHQNTCSIFRDMSIINVLGKCFVWSLMMMHVIKLWDMKTSTYPFLSNFNFIILTQSRKSNEKYEQIGVGELASNTIRDLDWSSRNVCAVLWFNGYSCLSDVGLTHADADNTQTYVHRSDYIIRFHFACSQKTYWNVFKYSTIH